MKWNIIAFFVALIVMQSATAAVITLSSSTPQAGAPFNVTATLGPQIDNATIVQFDLTFPNVLSVNSIATGQAALAAGKVAASNSMNDTTYRVIIYGANINTFIAGEIATFKMVPSSSATGTIPIQLKNIVCGDAYANPVGCVGVDTVIVIPATNTTQQTDTTPPVRYNGMPQGTLPAGIPATMLSLSTNENAICRYSTIAGTPYASMTGSFTPVRTRDPTGGTQHTVRLVTLRNMNVANYFVKCKDTAGNVNTDDYLITFNISETRPRLPISTDPNLVGAAAENTPDRSRFDRSVIWGTAIIILAGIILAVLIRKRNT